MAPATEPSPDRDFWHRRSVAVTGATGFVGSHLTARLTDLGAEVTVLVRDGIPRNAITGAWVDRATMVEGSIEDQALVERLLGEYEVTTLFHLAAQTQVGVANRGAASTWTANVAGTYSVLEACRRTPTIAQVVTASSDKAYGAQPELPYEETMPLLARHPYDVSKACADLIAGSYASTWGVPVTVSRCGNIFGPGDCNWARIVPGTIRSFLEGERPVIRSDGTLVRDYLYVQDAALAYLRLAEATARDSSLAGEAFNFSTETPITVLELVSMLARLVGTDLEPDVQATATHEIPAQHLSAQKARKLLGWTPGWTLEDALAETVAWYRGHHTASA